MKKLNFPGTDWRGLALIGAQKKPCPGMKLKIKTKILILNQADVQAKTDNRLHMKETNENCFIGLICKQKTEKRLPNKETNKNCFSSLICKQKTEKRLPKKETNENCLEKRLPNNKTNEK